MQLSPIQETNRIQSLDVLRGFALLGILLLNILGFGLLSPSYSNPGFDLLGTSNINLYTWATIEIFAEGSMRSLFSILFGAGVVLFTTGARGKSGSLHYIRTFWLFVFGLFNAFVLLWYGDILVTYAIAGAILYLFRNKSVKTLLSISISIMVLFSAFHFVTEFGLGKAYTASQAVALKPSSEKIDPRQLEAAKQWQDFSAGFTLSEKARMLEIEARGGSYFSAFEWNLKKTIEMLSLVLPLYLLWDALMMMALGMALFKAGILQGMKSNEFYIKLVFIGLFVGLTTNSYEVMKAINHNLDLNSVFAQMQFTYHLGRLGMAMAYLGLVVWCVKNDMLTKLSGLLADVGRMALSNYLLQSLICAILFTGLGFSLIGRLERFELYPIVFCIWVFQLFFSQWWMKRFKFGPVEWLWRALTYRERPGFLRE